MTALPERYRLKVTDAPESQLVGPAGVSGFIQLAVCGILYIIIFLLTFGSYPMFPMLEYAVDPKRIPLGNLAIEGAVRLLAAFVSSEVLPSLPLVVIQRIHGRFEGRKEAERMGPWVRDRVTRGDGKTCDWCVESWGTKPEWDRNPHLMILYRGTFYEIVSKETREPPRPHVL